ncbi:nuclear factor NF-kappa-B p105 subunit-like [Ptychodera flava]|uniref:nuclear factor NF-kappa-B p105 subunit-like n=1 Tax=Ptychodera flava TaxID=63121 RepID=UPI003969F90A
MTEEQTDSIEIPVDMMNEMIANGDIVAATTDISMLESMTQANDQEDRPYLRILTQPKSRGFRFRYGCEGGSHGGLPGADSEKGRRTFPAIEICNFRGTARVVVSLVTNDDIPRPHAHSLVGKQCNNGMCTVQVGPKDMSASFPNLGIRHVTKKMVPQVVKERILESDKLFRELVPQDYRNKAPLTPEDADKIAKEQAGEMDLTVVRLCFQAYIQDSEGNYTRPLDPVVSDPVFDSKAPNASQLKICRMDRSAGSCVGGDEVYLLCDKVQKDDIEVRFFEEGGNWEALGDFGPTDVHRQFAIVFKTPKYRNIAIDKPVCVFVQLRRKSDKEVSEPKPFTYHPQQFDKEEVGRKRKKTVPFFGDHFGGGSGGSSFSGATGGFSGYHGGTPGGGIGGSGGGSFPMGGSFQGFGTGGVPQGLQFGQMDGQIGMQTGGQIGGQMSGQMGSQVGSQIYSQMGSQTGSQMGGQAYGNQYQPPSEQPGRTLISRSVQGYVPMMPQDFKREKRSRDYSDHDDDICIDYDDDLCTDAAPFTDEEVLSEKLAKTKLGSEFVSGKIVQPYRGDRVYESYSETKVKTLEQDRESTKVEIVKSTTDSQAQTEPLPPPSVQLNASVLELAERTSAALQDYAISGDVKILLAVQRHLTAVQDENGDTALHLAIIHGRVQVIHSLLSVIISIPKQKITNQYNNLRQTPLHLAVITGQPQAVELLLRCGADTAILDRNGNTAAHLAAQLGSVDCMNVLLRQPRELKNGKRFPELEIMNYEGFTALQSAVKAGSLNCVRALVNVGASVNEQDGKSGHTALHHAVETENLAIIGYLILEAQADIHAPNFAGDTPLHVASGRGLLSVAALLVAAGADPTVENYEPIDEDEEEQEDEKDKDTASEEEQVVVGQTPLDLAVDRQMMNILKGEPYCPSSRIPPTRVREGQPLQTREKSFGSHLSSDHGYHSVSHSTDTALSSTYTSYMSGNISKLDAGVYQKLAKLLDPEEHYRDWISLADRLGLGSMINVFKLTKSPTKTVLDNYDAIGGTIEELMKVLQGLKRMDALKVIEDAGFALPVPVILEEPGSETAVTTKGAPSDSCESGLGSIQQSMVSTNQSQVPGMTTLPSDSKSEHLTGANQTADVH